MKVQQSITPDRKKSAIVGVLLSLFGIAILIYGTFVFSAPEQGSLFFELAIVIFGILLATAAVLAFVLPAAYDYWQEATTLSP
ncbi:MAG: hypothetical protein MUP63_03705 [Candidatus Nanohaloarchaeota archaeon QJJ-7]|nr:hypothetical protein [Candidatus Nanohaloarchaeota archaeon QJJ-7]